MNAADITIQTSDFTLNYVSTSVDVCAPNNAVFNFTYNTNLGFSGTTNFTSSGNPGGTTVTFNPTSASVDGTSVTVTVCVPETALLNSMPIVPGPDCEAGTWVPGKPEIAAESKSKLQALGSPPGHPEANRSNHPNRRVTGELFPQRFQCRRYHAGTGQPGGLCG